MPSTTHATKQISAGAQELKDVALEQGAAALEKGSEAIQELRETTEDAIAKHPYQSLLIAFGVGALLGAVLTRK